jgi:hypothetical protein
MSTNFISATNAALPRSYGPDILAEVLHLSTQRRSELAVPEKALMFAVLTEAVETYQKAAFSRSPGQQALFRETVEWFCNNDAGYLFSFVSVCELLGLDPICLRQGLMRWTANRQRATLPRKSLQLHSVRSVGHKSSRRAAVRSAGAAVSAP